MSKTWYFLAFGVGASSEAGNLKDAESKVKKRILEACDDPEHTQWLLREAINAGPCIIKAARTQEGLAALLKQDDEKLTKWRKGENN